MNNQQLLKNIINLEKKFESVNNFLINKGINIQQDNVSTTSDTLKKLQDEIKNIKNQDSTVELKAEIEKLKKQPVPAAAPVVNPQQYNELKAEIEKLKKQPVPAAAPVVNPQQYNE